ESEEAAEPYPDGVEYKQTLTDAAKKAEASTRDTIAKAQALYKDIVAHPDVLEDTQHQDVLYNNAETHFILRDYPATIAAGETLLNATLTPNPPIQAKTNYLMGHAAWKIASDTGDGNYTQVKEFYRNALDLDPFYGEKGNISHLAEIRLINAYFFVDQKYDEAIRRFEEAVKRYPESDYTYLTYFWYGQACEKYGDELLAQFKTQENSANTSPQDQATLREKAKNLFSTAVIQYRNAIDSRDRSKYKDSQNEEYLIQIMFNRGHCAFKAGSYKEAQQYLSEALEKYRDNRVAQPHIPQAMETLGDIHVLLANYGDAIRIYREYLSNSFDDTNARVSMKLAEAYLNRYSYDQAREWYSRIAGEYPPPNEKAVERALRTNRPIEQGPGFEAMKRLADSYYREASSYSGEDRVAKLNLALDAYKNLIKSYPLNAENRSIPSDPDAQREIGNLYYELGSLSLPVPNYQEAVNNYQAFLASNTNYPRKGMIYYRIGQALLQLQRTDPQAQQNITYIDDAITALSNITETSMDNPTQFAQALILLGQAFEEKANFYLKNGDEALWNRYLKDAENHYRRVGQTNIPDKLQEAKTYIDNIISRVNSRNELADIKP
ncbi:MAG: tetratricopeptide repeat protein, partial [bacterium]|nr:tetratricopeptide repeat protein [bacterium]